MFAVAELAEAPGDAAADMIQRRDTDPIFNGCPPLDFD